MHCMSTRVAWWRKCTACQHVPRAAGEKAVQVGADVSRVRRRKRCGARRAGVRGAWEGRRSHVGRKLVGSGSVGWLGPRS